MVESEVGLVCRFAEAQQHEKPDVCCVQALIHADPVLCSDALAIAALQPGEKINPSHPYDVKCLMTV